jgi:hypothetical protein
VFPMREELDFYIPEDDIPHSHPHDNLKSYIARILPTSVACQSYRHEYRYNIAFPQILELLTGSNLYAVLQTVATIPAQDTAATFGYRLHSSSISSTT